MTEFKFDPLKKVIPENPEQLFKSLKKTGGIAHAWAQQADSWREYLNHTDVDDLALELPTGSGKTLIGLVIGEWRRRKFGDKVLYLCPNNQLAEQVASHATNYGIKTAAMGKGKYDLLPEWISGNIIAVSSYMGLFNSNPKFKNPDVVILDDAHSAEDSIGSLWSVKISRKDNLKLHQSILSLYREEIQDAAYYVLNEDARSEDRHRTYCLAHPLLWSKKDSLYSLIEAENQISNSDWSWAWSLVKDKLHACQLFYSWNEILIRPTIAPTKVHHPFADAKQRIYLSATLGSGGELERITGIEKITRVPLLNQVENTGRRLFLFTNPKLSESQTSSLIAKAIQAHKRALVLTPTYWDAEQMEKGLTANGIKLIDTQNAAAALKNFQSSQNAALVLANRYDGIDLPGDSCRILVLSGKPAGANLIERFLITGLNATTVLRDRMRTRFVQGIGRCCRGDGDFAVVLIAGAALHEFCADSRIISCVGSEVQAEIAFGMNQSVRDEFTNEQPFLDLINLLMAQDDRWEGAENFISSEAKTLTKEEDPTSAILASSVSKEVRYQYELLKKNYSYASKLATEVANSLKSNKKLDGYRSWWLYLGVCALWLEACEVEKLELKTKVSELLSEASHCSNSVAWFSEIDQFLSKRPSDPAAIIDILDKKQSEEAFQQLRKLGLYDTKFDTKMIELNEKISKDNHSSFHEGLMLLGKYLGFTSHNFKDSGAPDCIWEIAQRACLIFEAKSEEDSKGGISLDTARQALAQKAWTVAKLRLHNDIVDSVTAVLTPRKYITAEAHNLLKVDHPKQVFYFHVNDIRSLADTAIACLRQIRSGLVKANEEDSLSVLQQEFYKRSLLFSQLKSTLSTAPLESLTKIDAHFKVVE